MKPSRRLTLGFTLVEIVLALGVASVFLVGIVSLLSTGLASSREAAADTRVSLIVRDVASRVHGKPMVAAAPLLQPMFYTEDGKWINPMAPVSPPPSALFGVATKAVTPNPAPANTNLLAIVVDIYWPVQNGTGGPSIPTGAVPKSTFSFYVTSEAGSGWSNLDSSFTPKVEF